MVPAKIVDDVDKLVQQLIAEAPEANARKRHIVIMSNGAFGGIYQQLTDALKQRDE